MHNLLGIIPIDERFWVALSFIIFCLISFFAFKNKVVGAMNGKISSIKNLLESSQHLAQQTKQKIAQIEEQLSQAQSKASLAVLQANEAGGKIQQSYSTKLQQLSMEIRASNKQKLAFLQNEKTSYIYKMAIEQIFANIAKKVKINELDGVKHFDFSKKI